MRRTAFSIAIAAEMFVLTGIASAQPTNPPQPPDRPRMPAPDKDRDPKLDQAERDRMQKEWDQMKKEWDALTPEARLLSVIHAKNLKEVELGKLGQTRASDAGVREFASMMVKDHTEADSKLSALVAAEKITLWDVEKTNKALKLKKTFEKSKDGDKDDRKHDGQKPGMHPDDRKPGAPADKPRRDGDNDGKRDHDNMKDPADKLSGLTGAEFDAAFGRTMHKGHAELLSMLEKHQGELTNTQVKSYVGEVTTTVRRHHEQAASLPGVKGDDSKKPHEDKPKDKEPAVKDPKWDR